MKIKDKLKSVTQSAEEISKSTVGTLKNIGNRVADITGETTSKVADKAEEVIGNTKKRFEKCDEKNQENKNSKKVNEEDKAKKINLDEVLKHTIEEYNVGYTQLSNHGSMLYTVRERSLDLLDNIENLINSIANKPKSFDADIEVVQSEKAKFKDVCEFAKQELELAKRTGTAAIGGVGMATAVASLAPSAAIWVATTFGAASTGTAISALSGAAATNAALAWLGGGAVATGGGGMVAGNALLALAGPIGWSIAGASILTSVTIVATNKVRNYKKKKEEIENVKTNLVLIRESTEKAEIILNETVTLRENLSKQYTKCMPFFSKNFLDLDEEQQLLLGALVNNSRSLSATLEKTL